MQTFTKILFFIAAALSVSPLLSAGEALLLGVVLAVTLGNPFISKTRALTHRLLSLAVIGLGAGMNLLVVAKVGVEGIGYTVVGIAFTFILGLIINRLLQLERTTSILITIGTAICGGSAIAAAAPVLRAKDHEVSVSLAVVFLLNACALFLFPMIGHYVNLSEHQFGLWSALAIHDTSSVVGATLQYGQQALEVGTTVKLARALWIVPVTLVLGVFIRAPAIDGEVTPKRKWPWFILGFIIVAALVTWVPTLATVGHYVETVAKRLLVLTLFLIGANLNRDTLKTVGFSPFLNGLLLWLIVASATLFAIVRGLIN